MNRYFYHYATSRQSPGGEILSHGTLDCAWMIDSSERFQEAMRVIAEQANAEVGKFGLTSLTLLNPPTQATPNAHE